MIMEDVVVIIQERERGNAHLVIMETQEAVTTEAAQIVAMEIMDLAEI